MMDKIHIALPSDNNYVQGLNVTAASIAVYAGSETTLHFHILDGGITDHNFDSFASNIKRLHADSCFSRYVISSEQFCELPHWGGNYMTYARLLLPELLRDVDHVIYSDTDVLWLAPIENLWAMRDDSVITQVSRDECPLTLDKEQNWFKKKEYPFARDHYFCAGIMLLNLEMFRKINITGNIVEFVKQNADLNFADQTAMNALLYGQVKFLSDSWQKLTTQIKSGPLSLPIVLHYGGELPWRRKERWALISDTVMVWHWFNDHYVLRKRNESLKQYYTLMEGLVKRVLFLGLTNICTKKIIIRSFRLLRRDLLADHFEKNCHKIQRKSLRDLRHSWGQFR